MLIKKFIVPMLLVKGINAHAQVFVGETILQDSLTRTQISRHYNSLAWHSILKQKLDSVEYYLAQSIKYDSLSPYPHSNLPLYLLLTKQYKKAKALYLKYKDRPFDKNSRTYKDEFLTDFEELKKAGITNRDIKKIKRLLNRNP